MSFMHQLKYRGMVQVMQWQPTHAQPRPGLIEANACVKRVMAMPKQSCLCVLSASADGGVNCVDTSFNPPRVIMSCSVYEIAHCGVDVTKPKYFTMIIGSKDQQHKQFYCHVFKCPNKETASKVTRAVASACTLAFQDHQRRKEQQQQQRPVAQQTRTASVSRGRQPSMNRGTGLSRGGAAASVRAPRGGAPVEPRLTDSWFRPSMTRAEVNTILRDARVGDFIVRESTTSPGDYAIAVQTGENIWTGLIKNFGQGFQLGSRGGVSFPELTELIGFYCVNKFMNDAWGYPLTLRLPYDESAAAPAGGAQAEPEPAFRVPDWRASVRRPQGGGGAAAAAPTFKNPPMFDSGSQAPACGWPESSDDEAEDFSFVPGRKQKVEIVDEADAFEKIMNQGLDPEGESDYEEEEPEPEFDPNQEALDAQLAAQMGAFDAPGDNPLDNLGDLDEALDALNQVNEEVGAIDDVDEMSAFDPRGNGGAPAAAVSASGPPIGPMSDYIYSIVEKDDEGCLGGQELRPVLMQSGLSVNVLGQIWMEVDQDRQGRVNYDQLRLMLGLISQAQASDEEFDLETLDIDTILPPVLDGIEVPTGGVEFNDYEDDGAGAGRRGRAQF